MRTHARARTITIPTGEYEPPLLAELTGNVREAEIAGGRVLLVEVDVARAGRFHFFADLVDDQEEPIGYAQRELELDAGVIEVALPLTLDLGQTGFTVSGLRVIRRWS